MFVPTGLYHVTTNYQSRSVLIKSGAELCSCKILELKLFIFIVETLRFRTATSLDTSWPRKAWVEGGKESAHWSIVNVKKIFVDEKHL